MSETACPCDSGASFSLCCGPYLDGSEIPLTAEQLMRSRYSAFVHCDEPYLLATWHAKKRPRRVRFDEKQHWLGLSIRRTEAGGPDDSQGTVEFIARFKINGKGHRLHETSRFEKIQQCWYYLGGRHH